MNEGIQSQIWKLNAEKQLSGQCFKERIVEIENEWRQKAKDTTDLLEKYKRENKIEIDKKQDMIVNLKDDVKVLKPQLKCAISQKDPNRSRTKQFEGRP